MLTVYISVYDLNGKEIQVVFNSVQLAGAHQTELDVSNLNAGVYLCKTVIGRDISVQRIVVSH
jgi:hypothetical protein